MRDKLLIGLLILVSHISLAQISVSGKITDDKGQGIPGASIVVKGTTTGTISDFDGNFSISIPSLGAVIVVSFVGFQTQEVSISSTTGNVIKLYSENYNLREVYIYHDFGNIIKQLKKQDKTYSNLELPNNEYNGRTSKLVRFNLMPHFSGISLGYHRNSFLNKTFGENLDKNYINRKFGTYIGADFGFTFITPLNFNITHFKSNYSYNLPNGLSKSKSNYSGWEFSLSKGFGFTNLPLLNRIIPTSYFGIGYHFANIDTKEPYYSDINSIKNKVKTPFWEIGFGTYPFRWIDNTYWFSRSLRNFIASTQLNFEYKQSLSANKAYSYNGWSLGLEFYPRIDFSDLWWDIKHSSRGEGFNGDDDFHEMFGGFHYRFGLCYYNLNSFDNRSNDDFSGSYFDVYYNNSLIFPISLELGLHGGENYNSVNFGIFTSYKIADHFTIDFGGGYESGFLSAKNIEDDYDFKKPYYKLGLTYMIKGKNWGGFNYTYMRAIGMKYPVPSHNLTYIFGRKPTKWLTIGVASLLLLAAAQ